MAFYVPDFATSAVVELLNELSSTSENKKGFLLTVTNNNNGVSVDKDLSTVEELKDKAISAEAVKELVNIVRSYDADEETNVCGW
ncbi:Protein YoaG [Pectobacterium sp. F1-1]|nr:Protein YoaG [Pectobacterium sp. F1-1]